MNHIFFFSFGFVFYWIVPIFFFSFITTDDVYYQHMLLMFNDINELLILKYLLSTLFIYIFFMLGSNLNLHVNIKKIKLIFIKLHFKVVLSFLILFILIICLILNRAILFNGYLNIGNRAYEGMLSSVLLLISSYLMLQIVYSSDNYFSKGLKSFWTMLFILVSMLILSTGGRLYVVSCIVSILCLYTVYYNSIKTIKLLQLVVIGSVLIGIIGMLRIGGRMESLIEIIKYAFYNVFSEPLYTSYSLWKYIGSYPIKLFNISISLLSSLINLIPTLIFPQKGEYLVSYSDLGYDIFAPLGALSSYASFNIEFGFIGTLIFIFIFSYLMKRLSKLEDEVQKVMYSLISGHLAFTFFRDAFSISLIKNIFEYSIIIPLIFNMFFLNSKTWIMKKSKVDVKIENEY